MSYNFFIYNDNGICIYKTTDVENGFDNSMLGILQALFFTCISLHKFKKLMNSIII